MCLEIRKKENRKEILYLFGLCSPAVGLLFFSREWAEPFFSSRAAWAGPGCHSRALPSFLFRWRAGPTGQPRLPSLFVTEPESWYRPNEIPSFTGFSSKQVLWDYLSKPQVIAYLLYVNFRAVCPSSRPQAPKTLEAAVGFNSPSTSFLYHLKLLY
jgi:hypothetical protein